MRLFLVVAILIWAAPSGAEISRNWDECRAGRAKVRVKSCTELLKNGKLKATEKARAYQFRGEAYLDLDGPASAIRDFDHAIRLRPNHWKGYYYKARALYSSGKAAEAWGPIYKARNFAKNDTEYAITTLLLGHIYRANGQNFRAQGYYLKVIKLAPNHWAAKEAKGYIRVERCGRGCGRPNDSPRRGEPR